MLTIWWAAFLLTGFADRVSANLWEDAMTVAPERTAMIWALVASAFNLVAGVCALRVVSHLTSRQEARAERLAALPGPAEARG